MVSFMVSNPFAYLLVTQNLFALNLVDLSIVFYSYIQGYLDHLDFVKEKNDELHLKLVYHSFYSYVHHVYFPLLQHHIVTVFL